MAIESMAQTDTSLKKNQPKIVPFPEQIIPPIIPLPEPMPNQNNPGNPTPMPNQNNPGNPVPIPTIPKDSLKRQRL